jgi:poly(A) polymerase Pap1
MASINLEVFLDEYNKIRVKLSEIYDIYIKVNKIEKLDFKKVDIDFEEKEFIYVTTEIYGYDEEEEHFMLIKFNEIDYPMDLFIEKFTLDIELRKLKKEKDELEYLRKQRDIDLQKLEELKERLGV